MASPTYQELFFISAGAQDCAWFNKEVETASPFAGRDNSSPESEEMSSQLASAERERWTAQKSVQPAAGILCTPPGTKLPSQLKESPGNFQALPGKAARASWGGDLGSAPLKGILHSAQEIPWAVPKRCGDRDHWENPSGCCTVASVAPARYCSFHPWDRALIYSCLSQSLLLGRKAII